MTTSEPTVKPTVLIIEDSYNQFQIIRELLKNNYNILPIATSLDDFNVIYAKLRKFLNSDSNDFPSEFNNYSEVSAFIVDYELIVDNIDITGVYFCEKTESIWNGKIPVLFLTILSEFDKSNNINKIKDRNKNIRYDYFRKPDYWGDKRVGINKTVSKSTEFKNDMKTKIDALISRSSCGIPKIFLDKI